MDVRAFSRVYLIFFCSKYSPQWTCWMTHKLWNSRQTFLCIFTVDITISTEEPKNVSIIMGWNRTSSFSAVNALYHNSLNYTLTCASYPVNWLFSCSFSKIQNAEVIRECLKQAGLPMDSNLETLSAFALGQIIACLQGKYVSGLIFENIFKITFVGDNLD